MPYRGRTGSLGGGLVLEASLTEKSKENFWSAFKWGLVNTIGSPSCVKVMPLDGALFIFENI